MQVCSLRTLGLLSARFSELLSFPLEHLQLLVASSQESIPPGQMLSSKSRRVT